MAVPFSNEYHLRTVAETAAKSCLVCFKPSSKVLITPNNKDFFYVCPSHLQDRGFASAKVDPKVEAEKRKREALQHEIDLVKKEYEEKQKKKGKKKTEDKKKADEETDEKERDEKIKSLEAQAGQAIDDGPRIFTLHKDFYTIRLDRLRRMEVARRQQTRMTDPTLFPSAPTGELSNKPTTHSDQ